MLTPLLSLDHEGLLRTIKEQYGVAGETLEFAPLGEDSWCYRLADLWISVRRDLRGHVPAAYEAAALLCDSGLEFVLAPLPGKDAQLVRRVGRWPIIVLPYLPVTPLSASANSPNDGDRVVEMLSRVHRTRVPAKIPTERYQLSFAADLDRALTALDSGAPDTGPYGARLHHLLSAHRHYISDLRAEFGQLAAACARNNEPLVLTHGEPIAPNILRHGERLFIADWGEAMWGPPERDWSHVMRTIGGDPPCRPVFRRLYDIRWILSEIAEYANVFLDPHEGGADDDAMWGRLIRYLPQDCQASC